MEASNKAKTADSMRLVGPVADSGRMARRPLRTNAVPPKLLAAIHPPPRRTNGRWHQSLSLQQGMVTGQRMRDNPGAI